MGKCLFLKDVITKKALGNSVYTIIQNYTVLKSGRLDFSKTIEYRPYIRIDLETNTIDGLEESTMIMQNPQPISLSKRNIIVTLKNVFYGHVKCIHLFNVVSVITKNERIKNSKRSFNPIQDILPEELNQDIHTYTKNLFNNVFTITITNPYLYMVPFPVSPIIIKTIHNTNFIKLI